MRVLLDTSLFIWATLDSPRLGADARKLISEASGVYVSAVSIWEIAIKRRLGKLSADMGDLMASIEASGFIALPISVQHAAAVEQLPDHHRDPFDRLLVAQAIAEPLRLLTSDATLERYSELVMRVS